MSNIKNKVIRGRPSKKNMEMIKENVEEEEKSNIELLIDEHIQETDHFLDELNNINFGKEFYQVPDNRDSEGDEMDDEYEEPVEPEELKKSLYDIQPSSQSINFINKLNSKRNNSIKPQKTVEKHIEMDMDEECEIYSKKPTVILGENKLLLINKITQYKQLFKQQLKSFKIKKNATVEELEAYLEEIQVIISIGSIDAFILDSITSSIKMCEGLSSYTKFDISGLADILKSNPQFNNLVKVCYLKYGVFSAVPPETQLLFLVATSAYMCIQVNKEKKMKMMYKMDEPMII